MKLPRRQFLHLAAGAAAVPAVSRFAWGQVYPTRPVRIVVPFAPAGTTDIAARRMGQWLSERLGQQFIVENRPGANGNIGTEAVVRAPPDGYTLLMVDASPAINATLYEKLNFNFIRDTAPVGSVVRVPLILVVHPSVPERFARAVTPRCLTFERTPSSCGCKPILARACTSVTRRGTWNRRGREFCLICGGA
jgi:tripartite-type tricarboxylate transporter receptor subunit TctC